MNLRRPDRLHKTAAGDAAYQNAKENTPHTMEAVVSSLKFDRVTTTNLGYRLNENRFEDEGGMFDEKNQQWKDAAKGRLDARLEGVGLTYFQPRDIAIRFYFDKDDRLLDWDTDEFFIAS